jgi:hypothetical protein
MPGLLLVDLSLPLRDINQSPQLQCVKLGDRGDGRDGGDIKKVDVI